MRSKKTHKYINLDELPRNGKIIDWSNCVGKYIYFEYDNVKGYIEILEYKRHKKHKRSYVKIKYNDYQGYIGVSHIKECKIGNIINKHGIEFKLNINDKLKDNKRDLTIIDREYRKDERNQNWKYYKYHCNKCGYEGWSVEQSLLKQKTGCACCNSKVIIKGINDIDTTDPWMVKYITDVEDAYKYTHSSNKKINVTCPECGRTKYIVIGTLYKRKTIGCACGCGFKYPNKFMMNILEQLNINFDSEYSPKWLNGKLFDFYDKDNNIIIEMDGGLGHGKRCMSNENSKNTKETDNWKDNKALEHGIKVIRVNCDYDKPDARFEFIKDNILKSELKIYYDFNNINWDKADEFATGNFVKYVCDFYNENKYKTTPKKMCKELNISDNTMYRYLKLGNELGWCEYKNLGRKEVKCIELNETFESVAECSRVLTKRFNESFTLNGISRVCRKIRKQYKGYTFEYINSPQDFKQEG